METGRVGARGQLAAAHVNPGYKFEREVVQSHCLNMAGRSVQERQTNRANATLIHAQVTTKERTILHSWRITSKEFLATFRLEFAYKQGWIGWSLNFCENEHWGLRSIFFLVAHAKNVKLVIIVIPFTIGDLQNNEILTKRQLLMFPQQQTPR